MLIGFQPLRAIGLAEFLSTHVSLELVDRHEFLVLGTGSNEARSALSYDEACEEAGIAGGGVEASTEDMIRWLVDY